MFEYFGQRIFEHVSSCFVAQQIYGYDDWLDTKSGSSRFQVALNIIRQTSASVTQRFLEMDKPQLRQIDSPEFVWMQRETPIQPPPGGFGSADIEPHQDAPNFAVFNADSDYTPVPRYNGNKHLTKKDYDRWKLDGTLLSL